MQIEHDDTASDATLAAIPRPYRAAVKGLCELAGDDTPAQMLSGELTEQDLTVVDKVQVCADVAAAKRSEAADRAAQALDEARVHNRPDVRDGILALLEAEEAAIVAQRDATLADLAAGCEQVIEGWKDAIARVPRGEIRALADEINELADDRTELARVLDELRRSESPAALARALEIALHANEKRKPDPKDPRFKSGGLLQPELLHVAEQRWRQHGDYLRAQLDAAVPNDVTEARAGLDAVTRAREGEHRFRRPTAWPQLRKA